MVWACRSVQLIPLRFPSRLLNSGPLKVSAPNKNAVDRGRVTPAFLCLDVGNDCGLLGAG
jgi:hypothetical protein